ncbi:hypothetical protein PZB74_22075 [Porifericola rhodea]|uniref:hypothetical protein n=1 Tax=Porifericola rhodea TaxID=930972 RepID=UPI002666CA9E|nr:hypothetical protein [Porifericola rhodea]WKN31637.1 hypothetical protein PZB74_22075 [Porifericola rhodea]
MKNLFILTFVCTLMCFSAQAQNTVRVQTNNNLAYAEGTNILDVGVGFGRAYGSYYAWGNGFGGGVPVSASFELGLHEYFSVGPYVAYASYGFRNTDYRANFFSVGAKGSFHYVALANEALDLDINEEKVDLYVSVYLGGEFYSDNHDNFYDNTSNVDFGTVIGGRYLFNENIGVYSEIGYAALAVWTIGLTVNL